MTETAVKLSAKLYQCRDTMRRFYGVDYPSQIEGAQRYIHAAMRKFDCDDLSAAMKLVEDLQQIPGSEMAQAIVLAGYVELVEPTPR